ncbi:hypothetical protein G7Y89_g9036 [Cudoniella acicularis]|uniref:Uncharacterized protein n=1 Tax=Cudoniella acicularis TaxID=354080 RepID=A0A8H4RH01_9HELO|nr:hypothetical protein G7Y89_g9036 [Cudoniella acicularis]
MSSSNPVNPGQSPPGVGAQANALPALLQVQDPQNPVARTQAHLFLPNGTLLDSNSVLLRALLALDRNTETQAMLNMPPQRDLALNTRTALSSNPVYIYHSPTSHNMDFRRAALGYTVGNVEPTPCNECRKGNGRMLQCITVPGIWSGVCVNCKYTSKTHSCSFHPEFREGTGGSGGGGGDDNSDGGSGGGKGAGKRGPGKKGADRRGSGGKTGNRPKGVMKNTKRGGTKKDIRNAASQVGQTIMNMAKGTGGKVARV